MKKFILKIYCCFLIGCSSGINKPAPKTNADTLSKQIAVTPEANLDSSLLVIDTAAKLCWMKNDFSFIKKRFLRDWKEIFEWQKEIDSIGYAGLTDWRVPTIDEYRTMNKTNQNRLLYRGRFNELDTTCAWGKGPYSFWSSTTPNENTASYISFLDGFATSGSRARQFSSRYSSWKGVELGMSVRLVRSVK
jgi:hypothetical protein